jgi:ABC-2 type transport system permease protein
MNTATRDEAVSVDAVATGLSSLSGPSGSGGSTSFPVPGASRASVDVGRIPFARLVGVEWTKATDTRAGRWLLALSAVSTAGIMVVPVVAPSSFDQTHAGYLGAAALALSILLPVVAILLFTGEWSQRSIMTTFTQEPRRLRVVNAKLTVSMALGLVAAAFGAVVTAAGIALASATGRTLEADLGIGIIIGYVLYVLLNVFAAVALGALLQSSAAAIAASFALPASFAVLGTASTLVSDWIDMSTTWRAILENDWAGNVAQIVFSIVFWVGAPLAAGIARTVRRDVG